MEEMVIYKNKINDFIGQMISEYVVFAPVKNNDIIIFKQIKKLNEIILDYDNSRLPIKSVFLPQTETLFRFSKDKIINLQTNIKDEKILIFCLRPCDAKSLNILDHVFMGEYEDSIYISKRKNSVLIGLTCSSPSINCFCTSVNGSPSGTEGMDILLTDIGDRYFVELVTIKGKKIVNNSSFFKPAKEEDKKKKNEIVKKAEEKIKRYIKCENLEHFLDINFENKYWGEISRKCLGCGICTFLCPTCHCFDIQDETNSVDGGRIRIWDSCMFPEYSLQASGYNPRPSKMNRIRNRIYHKFSYFPKNQHVLGCVGCGRCIDQCPVNIDITEIINNVRGLRND